MLGRERLELQQLCLGEQRGERIVQPVLQPRGDLACGHQRAESMQRGHDGRGAWRRLLRRRGRHHPP